VADFIDGTAQREGVGWVERHVAEKAARSHGFVRDQGDQDYSGRFLEDQRCNRIVIRGLHAGSSVGRYERHQKGGVGNPAGRCLL